MAFIIWNEGWFDLVERYGKSLTRSAWLLWKFWASLNFSHPEFEFLIIRRQTFLIPITQDICDVYSAREAEFSKPETQERQVIKGGWLRFTKARYLPNCQSEHHTEGDTSIGLAVTEWCMPCRFLDERFFTFRILTFVCCLRKEGKVGEGVHRHPRTTPQWTRTTPSPRKRNLWLLNAQGLHFPRFVFHDW